MVYKYTPADWRPRAAPTQGPYHGGGGCTTCTGSFLSAIEHFNSAAGQAEVAALLPSGSTETFSFEPTIYDTSSSKYLDKIGLKTKAVWAGAWLLPRLLRLLPAVRRRRRPCLLS